MLYFFVLDDILVGQLTALCPFILDHWMTFHLQVEEIDGDDFRYFLLAGFLSAINFEQH